MGLTYLTRTTDTPEFTCMPVSKQFPRVFWRDIASVNYPIEFGRLLLPGSPETSVSGLRGTESITSETVDEESCYSCNSPSQTMPSEDDLLSWVLPYGITDEGLEVSKVVKITLMNLVLPTWPDANQVHTDIIEYILP